MAIALGQHFGKQLIEGLGLPKNTRSVELCFAVDEPVTARCRFYPDDYKVRRTVELVERNFRLSPHNDWELRLPRNGDGTGAWPSEPYDSGIVDLTRLASRSREFWAGRPG